MSSAGALAGAGGRSGAVERYSLVPSCEKLSALPVSAHPGFIPGMSGLNTSVMADAGRVGAAIVSTGLMTDASPAPTGATGARVIAIGSVFAFRSHTNTRHRGGTDGAATAFPEPTASPGACGGGATFAAGTWLSS